ncbi:helix-turn-helix domain-containing protein [Marinimicrobium sp. C6131]|uniref:GlxA family transcriptional regulator n=1 Tax=Marinimicrobium sp. C6131 TaxID=3022676 RepID=UPI00223DD19D|nr:helix-turn-helix domain-containing protein [Marinimicrobium sp. C6131]UZJ45168.1 helix-turn-helix domain-containing protein [Marinimicrobium sp. C6131]
MPQNAGEAIQIAFLLSDNMLATSATLPMEMLLTAESASQRDRGTPRSRLLLSTVSARGEPAATRSGLRWTPDHALADAPTPDLVYVPGFWRNPRPIIRRQPEVLDWLREQYQNGALISAVGTGCCFLAEAGLLNGKPATTHWHYFDQFQRDYPGVDLKRQYFITQAGNLYCAASVNSLADLTVHFIQRLYNKRIASHVERHFSHEIRRSYESSGYFEEAHSRHPDEEIIQVQLWLQDNYPREVALSQVAQRFGLSTRTLNRRFKAATGQTPLEYLQEIRINNARDLLKTSNLTIAEIADKVGYQDTGYFTTLFKKQLAITPREYRATVRAKLFSAE